MKLTTALVLFALCLVTQVNALEVKSVLTLFLKRVAADAHDDTCEAWVGDGGIIPLSLNGGMRWMCRL